MANKVPDNVFAFLDVAARRYGQLEEETFSQLMFADCRELASPIEQMFLIAINLVCKENFVSCTLSDKLPTQTDDLYVIPQFQVGKYRVDFALMQHPTGVVVCVELDGHQFHDRDERQRRYEKVRDRLLTAKGYKVLHYTGSEVVKDPCAVALESFILATGLQEVAVHPLNKE